MLIDLSGLHCRRGDGPGAFELRVPELEVRAGQAVAITGPSGCGKSTLLDVLGLVLRPTRVERFHYGRDAVDVARLWTAGARDGLARLRAGGIGYVMQTGGLLPFVDVRHNIGLSPVVIGQKPDRAHLGRLIDTLGLGPLLEKKPRALSIGERQRAAIARALAHRPALVLADEPTASLDPVNARRVLDLLLHLTTEIGSALVLVSHDWDQVAALGIRRLTAKVTPAGEAGSVSLFSPRPATGGGTP